MEPLRLSSAREVDAPDQDAEVPPVEGSHFGSDMRSAAAPVGDHQCLSAPFARRADAALAHYRRTGVFHPADEVVAQLQARLDARRRQLRG